MNTTTIGEAAGIIWQHLSGQPDKPSTLKEIQKLKGGGANDAVAAVGWLAREGKLEFTTAGRSTRIRLCRGEVQA